MTKMYAALICLCFSFTPKSFAQRVCFSDNFDWIIGNGGGIPRPWSGGGFAGGQPYLLGLYESFEIPNEDGHNKVAAICDCSASANTDATLKSPVIDLTGVAAPWLRFDSYFQRTTAPGQTIKAFVEVSTDSGITWSTVSTVSPSPDLYAFDTRYLNLSAFANRRIMFGFHYTDSNALLRRSGWAVDNVKVLSAAPNDLALIRVLPEEHLLSYMVENQYAPLNGVVQNTGQNPITSFTVQYRDGSGAPQTQTITGVNIAPFDTMSFAHNIPFRMPDQNVHNITMTVQAPGDTSAANNSRSVILNGCAFMPDKVTVVEQSTGTWNKYAPRGIVYFNRVEQSDRPANLITVHGADPMDNTIYDSFINLKGTNVFNYQPSVFIDRRTKINPELLVRNFRHNSEYFGFADMDVHITAINHSGMTVRTQVHPAISMIGNYRLCLVLTEDRVQGSDPAWDQRNYYSGAPAGFMGGFESKPDPVPAIDMQYDHVARLVWPEPAGGDQSLPAEMYVGDNIPCVYNVPLDPSWIRRNMQLTVLLIDMADSTVLNSKRISLSSVGIGQVPAGDELQTILYPNPASDLAWLTIDLPQQEAVAVTVTDLSGKRIWEQAGQTMSSGVHTLSVPTGNMISGCYLVQVRAGGLQKALKLTVLH